MLDSLAVELIAPLALWVCLNGLDDVFLDLQFAWRWLRGRIRARVWERRSESKHRRLALLVPCWAEQEILERMLQLNAAAIRGPGRDVWVGLYPNDRASIEAFHRARARLPRIHGAVGPRDGPTTKADNLNAVWSEILAYEEQVGCDYDAILLHDAEDVIHPLEIAVASAALECGHMVQTPVLPIETGPWDWTHGVYCDEFAESHVKDLRVRADMGGFIPSAGVGTMIGRDVLDRLRIERGQELLNPRSLTEDYFLGLDVHAMGFRQCFPVVRDSSKGKIVATRSYFPRSFRAAVKQRTRWIIGSNLQAWERFGWCVDARQLYWLWRDRKSLINHGASLLTNLCFVYGAIGWLLSRPEGRWGLGEAISETRFLSWLIAANLILFGWRSVVRIACCRQAYGWIQSLTAPLRAPWANLIGFCATVLALRAFLSAKIRKQRLTWSKTAHAFPERSAPVGVGAAANDPSRKAASASPLEHSFSSTARRSRRRGSVPG